MNPTYDPKLKELAAKIEALCQEYSAGAFISLISKTHGEFRYVLPKWTSLLETISAAGLPMVRLLHKKELGHTHEQAELTAHFLFSLRDTAALCFSFCEKFIEKIDEKWKPEHEPFAGFRPHKEEH